MRHIFLAYRRSDTMAEAQQVYAGLRDDPVVSGIFHDVNTNAPGMDFLAKSDEEMSRCDAVLFIIGPGLFPPGNGGKPGRRRYAVERPQYLFDEIRGALDRNIPVVPVLVSGAQMPDLDSWPIDLRGVARRHGVELRDASRQADLAQLASALDAALTSGRAYAADIPRQQYRHLEYGDHTRESYDRHGADIRAVAHRLAIWFRQHKLICQVLYQDGTARIETTDPRFLRRHSGVHNAYSVELSSDGDTLHVDIYHARWTDLAPGMDLNPKWARIAPVSAAQNGALAFVFASTLPIAAAAFRAVPYSFPITLAVGFAPQIMQRRATRRIRDEVQYILTAESKATSDNNEP